MSYEMIKYNKKDAVATITLNRPEKYNTLRMEMIQEMDNALMDANQGDEIKVIVLEGAGDSFCGGFDFSGGLEHFEKIKEKGYDPGVDIHWVTNFYTSYVPKFMVTVLGVVRNWLCVRISSLPPMTPVSVHPIRGYGAVT